LTTPNFPGGDPSQAAIQTFTGLTGTSYTWFVTEAASESFLSYYFYFCNLFWDFPSMKRTITDPFLVRCRLDTQVFIRLRDSTGTTAESGKHIFFPSHSLAFFPKYFHVQHGPSMLPHFGSHVPAGIGDVIPPRSNQEKHRLST
jgi:hypothetical protein